MLDLILEKLDGAVRYERYIASLCPFHRDSRPSFFVYPDTYYCASCKAFGKTSTLLSKLSNLPERYVYHEYKPSENPFTRWNKNWGLSDIHRIASRNIKQQASHYLRERGISWKEQRKLELGLLDGFVYFPITNKWGELIGAVARVGENNTAQSKYYIPKGQNSNLLYVPSWKNIANQDVVYVTFGIVDAITLYILGKASASTTTGQKISPDAFDSIRKRIVFLPDQGEEVSACRLIKHLDWRGSSKSLSYPPGTKDISEWYILDREGLLSAI